MSILHSLFESFRDLGITIKDAAMGDSNVADHSASFARESEMLAPYGRHTGFAVTSRKFLSQSDSLTHLMICAGSGAGKSSNCIIPGILAQQHASLLINDNSGELWDKTAAQKRKDGYETILLDLGIETFTQLSSFYNPLARVSKADSSAIAKVTKLLVGKSEGKDKYWNQKAEEVLHLAIKIVLEELPEKRHLLSVLRVVEMMAADQKKMSEHIVQMDADTFRAWKLILSNSDNTRDSILSSAIAAISWIGMNESLAKLTSKDSIQFEEFRAKKVALYIRVPLADSETYQPLVNLFFTQFFNYILGSSIPDSKDRPIYICADEFGSLHIPGFPRILSNCRKWLLGVQMVVQSESQIKEAYGESGKDIVLANCSKLYMTGLDQEADRISKILGNKTITDPKTGHKKERALLSPYEVRTLPKNNAILLPKGGRKPILVKLKPYYEVSKLLKQSQQQDVWDEEESIQVPLKVFTPKTISS